MRTSVATILGLLVAAAALPASNALAQPEATLKGQAAGFVSDAALIPVETAGERRFALEGDAAFEVEEVLSTGDSARRGVLALRPQDVGLTLGGSAVVRAAMFMGDSLEVHLEWEGHALRAQIPVEARIVGGDRVRPVFARGIFFPDGAQ